MNNSLNPCLSRTFLLDQVVQNKDLVEEDTQSDAGSTSGAAEINVQRTFDSFQSAFRPEEMRCLALVAHNNMKPAMKAFVQSRQEVLKKFRLTGTSTTMTLLKSIFDSDKDVMYGPTFKSGPLGGDAEVCALMCQEELGAILFFMDPLDPHPHQCDIDALIRLSNVTNVLFATNPTSCHALTLILEHALKEGRKDMIPSFFHTLESPGVRLYKEEQSKLLWRENDVQSYYKW